MRPSSMDGVRFRPAPTVRRFRLGERTLVFSERAQQLVELNATADAIWSELLAQPTPRLAKLALAKSGMAESAAGFVDDQLGRWLTLGYWQPSDVPDDGELRRPGLPLRIGGLAVDIAAPAGWAADRIAQVFGQLRRAGGDAQARLTVLPWAGGFHIFQDHAYVGAAAADDLIPRLKALLTDLLIGAPCEGFYAHGALLARGGRSVFLAGAPGAGKTTLAMALCGGGYDPLADDIVQVTGAGLFHGVAFAPAVKQGAWPLLQAYFPELETWPVETRTDGCQVRYAPTPAPAAGPVAPDLFVILSREAGTAARSEPLDPVDALSALLAEAYSAQRRLEGGQLAALAQRFQTVTCRRLRYGGLEAAVQEIERLRHDPGA
jgi:hypothetical protein